MNKRLFIFGIVLVLVAATLCTAGCSTTLTSSPTPVYVPKNTPGYANYTNSSVGFAIQYPRSWNFTETNNSTTFILQGKTVVFAVLPQDLSGGGITLDDYVQSVLRDLAQRGNSSNFTVQNSTSTTLAGYPARTLTFAITANNQETIESTLQLAIINDVGYGLLYSAPESVFPAYTNVVANMTASFHPIS